METKAFLKLSSFFLSITIKEALAMGFQIINYSEKERCINEENFKLVNRQKVEYNGYLFSCSDSY